MPRLLKADGTYSYFNGLAVDNAFFHMVYCNIATAELQQLGLETDFIPLPMDCSNPKVWEGVRCDAMSCPVSMFSCRAEKKGLQLLPMLLTSSTVFNKASPQMYTRVDTVRQGKLHYWHAGIATGNWTPTCSLSAP